jgi:CHASE3 domain sensor protein
MSWLNNLRMTPKLLGSFIFVALLAMGVGVSGIVGVQAMNGRLVNITGNFVPSDLALLQTQSNVNAAIRYTRGLTLTRDPRLIQQYRASAEAARKAALDNYTIYANIPTMTADAVREARIGNATTLSSSSG